MTDTDIAKVTETIVERARARFAKHRDSIYRRTDRFFSRLLLAEWAFAILLAIVVSPTAWDGKVRTVHAHVLVAVLLGGAIVSAPVLLTRFRPGWVVTRHVVAVGQMLLSALLIHLTGGRIETHFHVFGSLAILAFYIDWTVLLTATIVVATDHLARGVLWPESVYGIVNPEWWRFLEHAGWVIFCITFLAISCRSSIREWLRFAEEGGMIEAMAEAERLTAAEVPAVPAAATTPGQE